MARRNDVNVLIQRKASLDEAAYSYLPEMHLSEIATAATNDLEAGNPLDIYPVRAVAQAEVLCRGLIKEMITSSRSHTRRAIELLANVKPDYELLLSVSDDQLTFADIVAHTVALNNLSSVITVFERLCEVKLSEQLPLISEQHGFSGNTGDPPLITDYRLTLAAVSSIFALRHRICHEGISPLAAEFPGIPPQILCFASFFSALDSFVTRQLYPDLPRTQIEMNVAASCALAQAQSEMNCYAEAIVERNKAWPNEIIKFEIAQGAWQKYVEAQQIMRHDPSGGGSIGPMLRAKEAELLTRGRAKHLKWYAERREGDL